MRREGGRKGGGEGGRARRDATRLHYCRGPDPSLTPSLPLPFANIRW